MDLSVFVNLKRLIMTYDSLSLLPKGLPNLDKLKVLDISANNFTLLPEELALIPHLEELYLNNELFLDFDQSFVVINKITTLKRLHLDNMPHFVFPKYLKLNTSIEYLSMRFDELHHIPDQLWKFRNLKTLDLWGNYIGSIPRSFLQDKEIEKLNFSTFTQFDFREISLLMSQKKSLYTLVMNTYPFNYVPTQLSHFGSNTFSAGRFQKIKKNNGMEFTNTYKTNKSKWALNHIKLNSQLLPSPANNFTSEGFGIRIGW